MRLNNGCKCSDVPDPVYSMANVHHHGENVLRQDCENLEGSHPELYAMTNVQHPAGDPSIIHDCKDPSRSMEECETLLRGDIIT